MKVTVRVNNSWDPTNHPLCQDRAQRGREEMKSRVSVPNLSVFGHGSSVDISNAGQNG